MDLHKTPAFTAIRRLILHTPQGWTYLFFSVLTSVAGLFAVLYPTVAAWGPFRAGSFLLVYPLLYLCALVGHSALFYDCEPSRTAAVYAVFLGVLPFLFPYIHDAVA
jgi:hypothetical protein